MYGNEPRGVRRAHSPDGYDNNQYRGPPQFRGHPGQPPYVKRHRGDNFQHQPPTIDERIARLGETGSRNADIGLLVKDIDIDLMNRSLEEEKIKAISTKICECIVSFPTRIATYSTLIGLLSVKHYNVVAKIINSLHASYSVYLEAQKWQEALIIIHLLSSLVNCKVIRPSTLVSQFEFLLEMTLEDNIPQARSDYYVYTVLSSLPYVALELFTETETQQTFEQILTTIETYLSKRSKDHLNVVRVWMSNDSTVQMDYLDSLWVQMKNFRANNWIETYLHRPYNDKEYKDTMVSNLVSMNFPTLQIPGHSENYVYPPPRIAFRIFEDDVTDGQRQIPGSDKIERFCIENHIRNIMDEISNEPRDCARHLSHMYRSDQLPIKHMLIETILGELLTVPRSKQHEIFYHSLLFEMTKIFQKTDDLKSNYDVILNEAVKVLYENLETMNVTCITRLIDWFTFHLNNTEFVYPWQTWNDATGKDISSPKAVFVQDVLDRCIRLSFHLKIDALVKDHIGSLMPPEVSVQYKPVFSDNPKAKEFDDKITSLITEKADGKTISEALNILIDGVEMPEDFTIKEEKHSEKLLKIDIFTARILFIARKSLTHLSSAIGKYRSVFKALTRVEQGQIQLLQTMHSCLETHPQLQVILVDKLLKAELVEFKEVCSWIFSESMKPHQSRSYPWELLNNTISRATSLVKKLEAERDELKVAAKNDAASSQSKPSTTDGEGDVEMAQADEAAIKKDVEKECEALEVKIEEARRGCKELLLQVFKLFAQSAGDHIRNCEQSGVSFMDCTFRWITGRMQEVYYRHYDWTKSLYEQIRTIIDGTPSIGGVIVNLNQ